MNTEKNYWPAGLAFFAFCVLFGIFWLLKVSLSTPVEMDNSFMMPYQQVENNYNEIMDSQKAFDAKYTTLIAKQQFALNTAVPLNVLVTDKSGKMADVSITAVATRPDTTQHDIKITDFKKTAQGYISSPISLDLVGRWKIMYKIVGGGNTKYVDVDTFVPDSKK